MATAQSNRRLQEIKNDFERGVFVAVYNSPEQRTRRAVAAIMLVFKHSLRGILFSWPLYMLALASFAIPGKVKLVFMLLLIPGVYVSWAILRRGVREDYASLVEGYILRPGFLGHIIFQGKA